MSGKYAKIKRQELKCLVEAEYGFTVKDMHENERGIILYTDKGIKMVKRCKTDEAKLLFSAAAYEHISNNGFNNISSINKTLSDRYFVEYGDRLYILQNFVPDNLLIVKTERDAAMTARTLAELHNACKNFIPAPGSHARVDWGKWMEKFKSYAFNINKFKKEAFENPSKNKFDRLFLKNADEFYERMYKAYLILKNYDYLKKVQHSMKTNQLTHKEYKKHSVLRMTENQLFVCNMEECAYDIPEVDLAALLESFSGSRRVELAASALNAYCSVNKLDKQSIKIIQGFLLQPKRFYKVVDRYYGGKDSCTETAFISKLEKSIKREYKKDAIINFLEDYAASINNA